MSANDNLEGLPIVSGKYNGPIRERGQTLLWGGGRTNMYWKGPKPSDVLAPVLRSNPSPGRTIIGLDITEIKGQTPFYYYLQSSPNPTGPFSSVSASTDLGQRHVGNYIEWDVSGFPIGTPIYFRVICGNGFGETIGLISGPIVS
jgi:hypothetical protein